MKQYYCNALTDEQYCCQQEELAHLANTCATYLESSRKQRMDGGRKIASMALPDIWQFLSIYMSEDEGPKTDAAEGSKLDDPLDVTDDIVVAMDRPTGVDQ
nr:uncharacterized protein LOC128697070 isoform X2 [Cherax quadricarinatus]